MPPQKTSWEDLEEVEEAPTGFGALQDLYVRRFGRPFRTTGTIRTNPLHKQAGKFDVGTKDLSQEQIDFITSNAPSLGLSVKDFSKKEYRPGWGFHLHLEPVVQGGRAGAGKGWEDLEEIEEIEEIEEGGKKAPPIKSIPISSSQLDRQVAQLHSEIAQLDQTRQRLQAAGFPTDLPEQEILKRSQIITNLQKVATGGRPSRQAPTQTPQKVAQPTFGSVATHTLDVLTRPFQYSSTLVAGLQRELGADLNRLAGGPGVPPPKQTKYIPLTGIEQADRAIGILDAAAERFYTGQTRPGYEQPVAELIRIGAEKYGLDPNSESAVKRILGDVVREYVIPSAEIVTDPLTYGAAKAVASKAMPKTFAPVPRVSMSVAIPRAEKRAADIGPPAGVSERRGIKERVGEYIARKVYPQGNIDPLTGLQNQAQWQRAKARLDADPSVEVAVIDANDLKKFNDQVGHDAGDRYLAGVGRIIQEEAEKVGISSRQTFRAGGDEFAVAGPKESLAQVMEQVRARVANELSEGRVRGSVSAGVGETSKIADQAMYSEKQAFKRSQGVRIKLEPVPGVERQPTIPETPATLEAQMVSLRSGRVPAVLIPPETQAARRSQGLRPIPEVPEGYLATRTPEGTFVHPRSIMPSEVVRLSREGRSNELLGMVEPKSSATTQVISARGPGGEELKSVLTSPEYVLNQVKWLEAQFPGARIEVGGEEAAAKILSERQEGFGKVPGMIKTPEGEIEYRHAGINPLAAVRQADILTIPPGSSRAPGGGSFSYKPPTTRGYVRPTGSPLSRAGQPGQYEIRDPLEGRQTSDLFQQAHFDFDQKINEWGRSLDQIEHFVDQSFKEATGTKLGLQSRLGKLIAPKAREEHWAKFVDLIEKPLYDPDRISIRSSNTPLGRALDLHDKLTGEFKQYIRDSQEELGRELPEDWGITDKGYYRHLFSGGIQIFKDGHFIGTANTYAEAQARAFEIWKTEPTANVTAKARSIFAGDLALRVSNKRFWGLISRIKKSIGTDAAGDFWISSDEIREDMIGIVGRSAAKQKPLGALFKRVGYEGYSKDYPTVMRIHAAQVARTQELSKLNRQLQPIIEDLKANGKGGLAEDIQIHLDHLWGTPKHYEKSFGDWIRGILILRNNVANPDYALRTLARKLTSTHNLLKLDFNIRSATANLLQPLSTLWPYVSTKEFASLYAEALRPGTRQRIRELGVMAGPVKLEEAGLSPRRGMATPFRAASELNRVIGYLHGEKDATRLGLSGNQAKRWAMEWAERVEFDNSQWNVAPILRSPVSKVILQYKGFLLKELENLRHLARSQPTDTRASRPIRIAKGVAGKVGPGGLNVALKALSWVAGYKIIEHLSQEMQDLGMERETADYYAEAVLHGAPSLIGMDMSGTFSLIDVFGRTPEEQLINLIGGPTVGAVISVAKGKAPSITPYSKTYETGKQLIKGEEPSIKVGKNERIALTKYEAIMRMLGFTPMKQTRYYGRKEALSETLEEEREKTTEKGEARQEAIKKLREGEPVEFDREIFSQRDIDAIERQAKKSEEVAKYERRGVKELLAIWDQVGEEERESIRPILERRADVLRKAIKSGKASGAERETLERINLALN